jgi:O-antigen/teichoic acid export membrane protein
MRVAEQLLLVPLLLAAWGPERYGEWMALTSIAMFAMVANCGIGHAGFSDIVLRYGAGDREGAGRSFVTSLLLITIVILGGCALLLAALWPLDILSWAQLHSFTAVDARVVVLIVGLSALLTFYAEPLTGMVSAVIGAGTPNLLFGISKAMEVIGIAVALQLSASPLAVAAVILSATLLNLIMNFAVALACAPWISFGLGSVDSRVLQRTWKASLGFFSIFVCINIVNVQVPRLIVFQYFGAAALTSFSVMVTYTRAARLIALMMSQAGQVEIGRAFAHDDFIAFKSLTETILGASIGLAIILLGAELLLAPIAIPAWTRGNVEIDWSLLAVLAIVSLIGTYFDAIWLTVSATNRISFVAVGYAVSVALGLALGSILMPWLGLLAVGLYLLIPDFGGAIAALRTLRVIAPSVRIRSVPLSFWPSALLVRSNEASRPK